MSGGTVEAAGHRDEFPHYRYGGMWKNKHEFVSAKMPKKNGKANSTSEQPAVPNAQGEKTQ